jgi:hypothetical protein
MAALDADAQDRALGPVLGRRVIFATNIAETSLTQSRGGDGDRHRLAEGLARYDAERAHLMRSCSSGSAPTARISAQRTRGAARSGPGSPLWDSPRLDCGHRASRRSIASTSQGILLGLIAAGNRPEDYRGSIRLQANRLEAAFRASWRASVRSMAPAITRLGQRLRRLPLHRASPACW